MADKIDEDALRFGQMLQSYREGAKVTQQDIADATGLTKNYISSIERGVHKCNAQTFIAYAKKVLITNLNRFEFPAKKMKELYHIRWDIETSFRELKYALGAVQFHSRKDDFVEMELIAHLIMFNVVSRTINAVSVPQSAQKKYKYVLSFKDAVTLVRKYFRLHAHEPSDRIYAELLGYTRPVVSGRADKRNMKPKSAVWFVYRVA